MSRLSLSVVVLLAVLALSTAAPKKKTRNRQVEVPPNGMKFLTKEERKAHPKFVPTIKHRAAGAIPDKFDARTRWPKCNSIKTIRNQGRCGTCWAVCAASVLSDRLCIATDGAFQDFISSTQIAGCVDKTQTGMQNCQDGGNPVNAFAFAAMYGVCTGGEFHADGKYTAADGCQPYFVGSSGSPKPVTCQSSCTNSKYSKTSQVSSDLTLIDSYFQATYDENMSPDQIKQAVQVMQTEIMTRGPICIGITAYSDFQDWSAGDAPYCKPSYSASNEGGHAMRIVGWDRDAKTNTPYWIITNSWGTELGDNGIYKIAMNQNCVGIEHAVSAPIVKVSNNCGNLCDKVPDQIFRMNPDDSRSPVYAFIDNCTVQVNVGSDGKLTPVGSMSPTEKLFLGAPAGPIAGLMQAQDGSSVLINKFGAAGFCSKPDGSNKFQCGSGSAQNGGGCQTTVSSTGQKYILYADKPTAVFVFPRNSRSGSGAFVDKLITDAFREVKSLLDIDGQRLQICGTDKNGKAACGAVKYSELNSQSLPKKWETAPSKISSTCK